MKNRYAAIRKKPDNTYESIAISESCALKIRKDDSGNNIHGNFATAYLTEKPWRGDPIGTYTVTIAGMNLVAGDPLLVTDFSVDYDNSIVYFLPAVTGSKTIAYRGIGAVVDFEKLEQRYYEEDPSQRSIIEFRNMVSSDPQAFGPSYGDRYVATTSGTSALSNVFVADYIYEWNGNNNDWTEVVPENGFTLWDVATSKKYIYNAGWSEMCVEPIPMSRTVLVGDGMSTIVGKTYPAMTAAIAYIQTQVPSASTPWAIKAYGTISDAFTLYEFINISGTPASATVFTNTITVAATISSGEMFQTTISHAEIQKFDINSGCGFMAYTCRFNLQAVPTFTGETNLYMLDSFIVKGDFSGHTSGQIYMFNTEVVALDDITFGNTSSSYPFIAYSSTINGNAGLGGTLTIQAFSAVNCSVSFENDTGTGGTDLEVSGTKLFTECVCAFDDFTLASDVYINSGSISNSQTMTVASGMTLTRRGVELLGTSTVTINTGGDYVGNEHIETIPIEWAEDGISAPDAAELYPASLPSGLTISGITDQGGDIFRHSFSGSPDLSLVFPGLYLVTSGTVANDGTFIITAVNDGSDYIEVNNSGGAVGGAAGSSDVISYGFIRLRKFAHGSSQDVVIPWTIPKNIVGTKIQYQVRFLITEGTAPSAEGVAFALSGFSSGNGDAISGAYGSEVSVSKTGMSNAVGTIIDSGWSANTTITDLSENETAMLKLYRDHDHVDDDYAQKIGIAFIQIKYQT